MHANITYSVQIYTVDPDHIVVGAGGVHNEKGHANVRTSESESQVR